MTVDYQQLSDLHLRLARIADETVRLLKQSPFIDGSMIRVFEAYVAMHEKLAVRYSKMAKMPGAKLDAGA